VSLLKDRRIAEATFTAKAGPSSKTAVGDLSCVPRPTGRQVPQMRPRGNPRHCYAVWLRWQHL
jgi:hypothetical protein